MSGTSSTVSSSSDTPPGDCQVTARLLDLVQSTNYQLVQVNGQRRLTAPEFISETNERIKGAEIFIGHLPRNCYEDELMPVLESVGRLLELRLMMDFSGTTRGYAFALYEDSKIARRACQMLDGFKIRPGHRIGAVRSVDNCRLFFGGVPKDKSKTEFFEELSKVLEGIVDVYLYPNSQDRRLNRGFIFVEFKDHRAAAMARRQLVPGRVLLWDHEVAVDWAVPEPGDPVDEEIMESVTALFVRNLSIDMAQQKVRDIFQKTTNISVLKLKKINHFAFIHYDNREMADAAYQIMTKPGGVAEKENWEIRWAKPIGPIKQAERQRCINEAIAKGKAGKESTVRTKKGKNQQKNVANMNNEIDISAKYAMLLMEFVSSVLQASCTFECIQTSDPKTFIYKIRIHRNLQVIFEHVGGPQIGRELALQDATVATYQRLVSIYDFNFNQIYAAPVNVAAPPMYVSMNTNGFMTPGHREIY